MRSGRGGIALAAVLLVAVVVGVLLSTRVDPVPPFDIDSARPDGMKALRLLLEEHGAQVRSAPASALADGSLGGGPGRAVVMMVPSLASADELDALDRLALEGTTVVHGERPLVEDDELAWTALDAAAELDDRTLADEPPLLVPPGSCDIEVLADLGDIDAAFTAPIEPLDGEQRCYVESAGANIVRGEGEDGGSIVTLSSPFLWVNARLQPAKEQGGEPFDNGATAVRLLAERDVITFVDVAASPDALVTGSQDPLSLMPLPVKLALAQLFGALAVFIWWRARRLGPPVAERLPVEVAGSELVVAVGDLLRRRGNAARAASVVRADARRVLAERIGLGPDPDPRALVEVVAARTGRPPAEVGAVLYDAPDAPITDAEALVRLTRSLDSIRQEVLHVVT